MSIIIVPELMDRLDDAQDRLRGEGWDDSADYIDELIDLYGKLDREHARLIERLRDCRAARKK
jgi:hypothetical protein